jgi:hypothetical protein
MANLTFDTKLGKSQYDRLNSTISVANTSYFAVTTAIHTLGFMYLSYFFRFRRVGLLPTAGIACAYYYAFTKVNNAAYKLLVDREVIATARALDLRQHVQPIGHHKNRGFNFQ